MENINSSAVETHNNFDKHFNNGHFSENQVNIINRNSDLKNGYHDETNSKNNGYPDNEIDPSSNVNLCCISVKNSDSIANGKKVLNGVEPKYVSIIDVNSSPDLVTVNGCVNNGCLGSVYTNGKNEEGAQDLGKTKLVNNLGAEHCLASGNSFGTEEPRGILGVQRVLVAENGFGAEETRGILGGQQVLVVEKGDKVLSSGQNLQAPEETSGLQQFSSAENGAQVLKTLQEFQDISGSESILVTESGCNAPKDILGSGHLLKAESDHQKLHQTNSGTSDEDSGYHLAMTSKFSNHMNSLGSSSGYETDPNVSIVEVNVGEIMKPVTDSGKVCRNGNEVDGRDKVMDSEGWIITDDEDDVDGLSQTKSLQNNGDIPKTNGRLASNKCNLSERSQSLEEDEEDSKDMLMDDDDIDEAMARSDGNDNDEDKSKSNLLSRNNDDVDEPMSKCGVDDDVVGNSNSKVSYARNDVDIDEEVLKSDGGSSKADDKLRRNVGSARNDDQILGKPVAEKSRDSQESEQGMNVDDDDEEPSPSAENDTKSSDSRTSAAKKVDAADSVINGSSNSGDDEESSLSAANGVSCTKSFDARSSTEKNATDAANSAQNGISNSAAANSAQNGTSNSVIANSSLNGTSNSGNSGRSVVDQDDDDDDSCLDGYSSNDEDYVDAKMDGDEQPKKPQLKRTRSNAGATDYWNEEGEDGCIVEFLDKSTDCAEARLAAKRQARAEAREIRMRELERQQREAEETADKVYDIYSTPDAVQRSSRVAAAIGTPRSAVGLVSSNHRTTDIRHQTSDMRETNNSYHSSRRSSEDSLEETCSLRDMRHELKEVEEKFRKAMIANAQLDNEKAAAAYQVELLKDRLEEMDENHSQLNREHREKCRQFEALKRATAKLQEDLEWTRAQLEERDRLIEEQGLVIVGGEYSSSGEDDENESGKQRKAPKRALVSTQVAEVLEKVGSGSLDVRLKKFVEQRNELLDELNRVKLELEEERTRNGANRRLTANGPLSGDGQLTDLDEIQREANKLISDYKFRLQKADQDNSTLQATVARLESQVVRYKTAAEVAEKVEDDLKAERRKLQREYRESQARVEELETAHSHLQKRLDKLKNAKSALLKEL